MTGPHAQGRRRGAGVGLIGRWSPRRRPPNRTCESPRIRLSILVRYTVTVVYDVVPRGVRLVVECVLKPRLAILVEPGGGSCQLSDLDGAHQVHGGVGGEVSDVSVMLRYGRHACSERPPHLCLQSRVDDGGYVDGEDRLDLRESATLSIRDLTSYRVDDEAQLRTQVLAAVRDSARYADLQAEMARVLKESRALASGSRERVSAVLHHHGLA